MSVFYSAAEALLSFFFVFFNFSNVHICFVLRHKITVQFFFFVFVNFSNVHWFLVKVNLSDWVERDLFSLAVFGGNLLADDVDSNVAMDRHVQS